MSENFENCWFGKFFPDMCYAFPIVLPIYVGLYRWAVFLLLRVLPSLFYRPYKPKVADEKTIEAGEYVYTKEDVTCVIPVYEPPPSFTKTIEHLVKNGPGHIIVVSDITCENHIREMLSDFPTVQVIPEEKPGKRPALVAGVRACETKLVCFVDDDVQWVDTFLENLIAPFQDPIIGGVGCKQVARIGGPFEIIQILADMRLAVRYLELRASTTMDKGCSCISGRTGCYKTELLKTEEFYDYFLNEKFAGMQLQSGDDKCVTRYMYKTGHKTYHQFGNKCSLSTSFETGMKFLKQNLRWSRNTWRSDIKAVFIERDIWKVCPITAFMLLDKMITPFTMAFGMIYMPVLIIMKRSWPLLLSWVVWLLISRSIKLCYNIWEHPSRILYVPIFIPFQYALALVRIYTLLTLNDRSWGTRSISVVNNQVVRVGDKADLTGANATGQQQNQISPLPREPYRNEDVYE
jgi:cellulose synthase/poly-beta-1,6-N-acetylglucosamine synthase-like glycosyltransferase